MLVEVEDSGGVICDVWDYKEKKGEVDSKEGVHDRNLENELCLQDEKNARKDGDALECRMYSSHVLYGRKNSVRRIFPKIMRQMSCH